MVWKFRGYDAVGSKGWVYGDLVHNKRVDLTDRVMVGGYEVVPESVGLWTGLKDKNGKEVFGGDILLFKNLHPMWEDQVVVVEWSEFGARFETGGFNIRLCMDNEIIGNVYQNKELLNNEQGN
jgi:hypothetical protein